MFLKWIQYAVITLIAGTAHAKLELANFSPGEYTLRTGTEENCPVGEFKLYNDGRDKLALGGLYIFDLRNFKQRLEDNLDESAKCYYDSEDSMDVTKTASILVYKETYKCGDLTKHILTRKLTINKGILNLDVQQEGEPNFKFGCSWALDKRKVNSVKKK